MTYGSLKRVEAIIERKAPRLGEEIRGRRRPAQRDNRTLSFKDNSICGNLQVASDSLNIFFKHSSNGVPEKIYSPTTLQRTIKASNYFIIWDLLFVME
jgi:hypothetical protein